MQDNTENVCVQIPTYADNVALPAFARRCCWALILQQSIDIFCTPGPQQETSSSGFAAVGSCWNRQTDTVPLRRHCSAYYAGSANNTTLITSSHNTQISAGIKLLIQAQGLPQCCNLIDTNQNFECIPECCGAPCSIDRYLLPTGPTATNLPQTDS